MHCQRSLRWSRPAAVDDLGLARPQPGQGPRRGGVDLAVASDGISPRRRPRQHPGPLVLDMEHPGPTLGAARRSAESP
ncbi:hypothetical protein HBB16_14025 [Pseudonocardia sp. MCCB 268]|nr:hypothetical protein [Pseudonocardia cytotoxica]